MKRRDFLKGVAGVGIAATIAGCTDSSSPRNGGGAGGGASGGAALDGGQMSTTIDARTYSDRFDEVVYADEVGADANGRESINPVLNSYVRPGTLLVFRSGEYLMTSPHRIPRSGPVGVIGQNATIRHGSVESISGHRVTAGEYSGSTELFSCGSSNNPYSGFFVFGGFTFDFSQENEGMQALNAHTTGEAIVENVRISGQQDLGTHGPFRLSTQSDPSVMLIRNIDMRHGGRHYVNTINTRQTPRRYGSDRPGPSWSTSGMTITDTMSGTMLVENVACGAWPDNGLYLKGGEPSNNVGRKIIRGCRAANSNVSNIRTNSGTDWVPHPWVDGDASTPAQGYEQSVIENCEVVVTNNFDTSIYGNQLGIRLDDGAPILRDSTVTLQKPNGPAIRAQDGVSNARIENVEVNLYAPARGIVVAGSASVANSVINTVGFDSSSVVAGVTSGYDIQQLAPADVQSPHASTTQSQSQSQSQS